MLREPILHKIRTKLDLFTGSGTGRKINYVPGAIPKRFGICRLMLQVIFFYDKIEPAFTRIYDMCQFRE